MSPRKRRISDHDLLEHAARLVASHGADHVRLADVAAAAQLAAPTLVQRFGSREGMLEAMGGVFIEEIRAAFARAEPPFVEYICTALLRLDGLSHLRFLSARPAQGSRYSLELRKQIGLLLVDAMGNGELAACDVAAQARRLQLAYLGLLAASLLEGSELSRVELETVVREPLADYV